MQFEFATRGLWRGFFAPLCPGAAKPPDQPVNCLLRYDAA